MYLEEDVVVGLILLLLWIGISIWIGFITRKSSFGLPPIRKSEKFIDILTLIKKVKIEKQRTQGELHKGKPTILTSPRVQESEFPPTEKYQYNFKIYYMCVRYNHETVYKSNGSILCDGMFACTCMSCV